MRTERTILLSLAAAVLFCWMVFAQVRIENSGGVTIDTADTTLDLAGTNIWVDSMVPASAVHLGPTAPSWIDFNGGNMQVLAFNNNQDDTVDFQIQLNHDYRNGTPIEMHVHCVPAATTGAGSGVVFQLEYSFQAIGEVFPSSSTTTMTNDVGANWTHHVWEFPDISGTGMGDSSILVGRLTRLASSATADDYNQDIGFIGIDAHYRVDGVGSTVH